MPFRSACTARTGNAAGRRRPPAVDACATLNVDLGRGPARVPVVVTAAVCVRTSALVREQLLSVAAIVIKGSWLDQGSTQMSSLISDLTGVYSAAADESHVRRKRSVARARPHARMRL